jgi:hypothetical protein
MDTDEYQVENHHIRTVVPAQAGARCVFCWDDGAIDVFPVLAWATYRTKVVWYKRVPGERARKVHEQWSQFEYGADVGGMFCGDGGLELCEKSDSFVGYLAPGESIDAAWWERVGGFPMRAVDNAAWQKLCSPAT